MPSISPIDTSVTSFILKVEKLKTFPSMSEMRHITTSAIYILETLARTIRNKADINKKRNKSSYYCLVI